MKKKKKPTTNEKADQFLAGLGTSGGAIGSPQLINFGASDLQNQLIKGSSDEYASYRMRQGDTRIGQSAAMPSDLDASYVKLNLPGSPLGPNGLLAPRNLDVAQQRQDIMLSQEQLFLARFLPLAGLTQLPVGQPPLELKKGKK